MNTHYTQLNDAGDLVQSLMRGQRAYILLSLLLSFGSTARALDLSVTARAEAGLDPATRNFITTLPDVWRPKLEGIVDDTLNRVDRSFQSYVQQINTMISNQIIDVQCHVLATEKGAVDDIVSRLPWAKPGGPLEKLRENIAKDNRRRRTDSTATFIKTLYDDDTVAASVVACQAGGVQTAVADAKSLMAEYGQKWLVWNRIESFNCGAALACGVAYRTYVAEMIHNGDPRDVSAAGAQVSFAAVKIPETSHWSEWLSTTNTFDGVETALTQLFNVENAIGGARAVREISAGGKLAHAEATLDGASKQLDTAFNSVRPRLAAPPIVFTLHTGGGSFGMIPIPMSNPVHFSCQQAFDSVSQERTQAKASLDEAKREFADASLLAEIVKQDADQGIAKANDQLRLATDSRTFCKGFP